MNKAIRMLGIEALALKQRSGICLQMECQNRAEPEDQLCRQHWLALSPETRRELISARNARVTSKGSPECTARLSRALARLVTEINATLPEAVETGE